MLAAIIVAVVWRTSLKIFIWSLWEMKKILQKNSPSIWSVVNQAGNSAQNRFRLWFEINEEDFYQKSDIGG